MPVRTPNGVPARTPNGVPARTPNGVPARTPNGVPARTPNGVPVWAAALDAPPRPGPPVWIHADLQPGNVLTSGGRLSAVIDFGCLGLGDPAVDLIAAWYLLPAGARPVFRTALADGADDAAWARGRGWALSVALLELSAYRETNPVMADIARHVIREVLATSS